MTIWTERTAGESAPIGTPTADLVPEEPTAVLIHDGVPDWVKDPTTGQQARVEGIMRWHSPCPRCQTHIRGKALVAKRPGHPDQQLLVLECPAEKTYLFMSRPRIKLAKG